MIVRRTLIALATGLLFAASPAMAQFAERTIVALAEAREESPNLLQLGK